MKFTEKLLRHPLPDQLKAVLEKFDGDFDASHLRRLKDIIDSEGITRYERLMLKRTYRKAKREIMLTEAMELVINAPRERDRFVVRPKSATVTSATEQMLLNQKYDILKRDIEQSMMNIGGMYR
jgi:hypothetical protein